jgi:hypothetical protein
MFVDIAVAPYQAGKLCLCQSAASVECGGYTTRQEIEMKKIVLADLKPSQ